MSGGAFDYFFSKDPNPETETQILVDMQEEFREHREDYYSPKFEKVVYVLEELYGAALAMEMSFQKYKELKEKNYNLLKDIEWAASGDSLWKDIPRIGEG